MFKTEVYMDDILEAIAPSVDLMEHMKILPFSDRNAYDNSGISTKLHHDGNASAILALLGDEASPTYRQLAESVNS
jgi:hypothetical protein